MNCDVFPDSSMDISEGLLLSLFCCRCVVGFVVGFVVGSLLSVHCLLSVR